MMAILMKLMYYVESRNCFVLSVCCFKSFVKNQSFSRVLAKDQFHKLCVPLYVSTLVHLNKVTRTKIFFDDV
jgi:hypothetical protein